MSRRTITANVTGKAYKRTLNGREYYVVPMSMLVPGVLHGSKGPLYYPPEEVTKGYTSWNGMPIVLDHPTQNGVGVSARSPGILDQYGVGYVFNATKAKGKLDAEGWFDIEKSNQVDPRIIASIERNQPFELSTGLFTDNIPEEGVHNGRRYTHVAKNYRPDHLAVFFGKKGACSLNDGCGVLINADFDESKVKRAEDGKFGSGTGSSKASSSGKADASAIAQVKDYIARGGKKKKKPSEKKVSEKKLKAVAAPKVKATDIKGGSKGAGASGPAKVIDELGKMNSGKQTISIQQADGSVVNIPNPHFKGDGKVAGKKLTANRLMVVANFNPNQPRDGRGRFGGGGGGGGSSKSSGKGKGGGASTSSLVSKAVDLGTSARNYAQHKVAAAAHLEAGKSLHETDFQSAKAHYKASDAHHDAGKNNDRVMSAEARKASEATRPKSPKQPPKNYDPFAGKYDRDGF